MAKNREIKKHKLERISREIATDSIWMTVRTVLARTRRLDSAVKKLATSWDRIACK